MHQLFNQFNSANLPVLVANDCGGVVVRSVHPFRSVVRQAWLRTVRFIGILVHNASVNGDGLGDTKHVYTAACRGHRSGQVRHSAKPTNLQTDQSVAAGGL